MEHIVNPAFDSPLEVTSFISDFSKPFFLVPLLQPTQPIMLDQLIADIDRDIHCFDRVAPAQTIPNGNQTDHFPSYHNRPHTSSTALLNHQPTKPIHSGPLKDITNISLAHP